MENPFKKNKPQELLSMDERVRERKENPEGTVPSPKGKSAKKQELEEKIKRAKEQRKIKIQELKQNLPKSSQVPPSANSSPRPGPSHS